MLSERIEVVGRDLDEAPLFEFWQRLFRLTGKISRTPTTNGSSLISMRRRFPHRK
jgi:hypothetical protein